MKFVVFENDKQADCYHYKVNRSWDKSEYDNLADAIAYARKWLGNLDSTPENWDGSRYGYSVYGDTIEIRQVADDGLKSFETMTRRELEAQFRAAHILAAKLFNCDPNDGDEQVKLLGDLCEVLGVFECDDNCKAKVGL